MHALLKTGNLLRLPAHYATDYEMDCCLNLRLDFGLFSGQFVQKS